MYKVEMYARVRQACMVEDMSIRAASGYGEEDAEVFGAPGTGGANQSDGGIWSPIQG